MHPVMTGSCMPLGSREAGTLATDGCATCSASCVRADGALKGDGGASMPICLYAAEA